MSTLTRFGPVVAPTIDTKLAWHVNERLNDSITRVAYVCAGCGREGSIEALRGNLGGLTTDGPCELCGCRWLYPMQIVYRVESQ